MSSPKNDKLNPFENLTVQECHLLYATLLQNADRHTRAAILLAKTQEYGLANAHLTIAAEDYIRALSVYLAGWGLPVSRIKKMISFFAEQDEGYTVSPGVVIMGNFTYALFQVFESVTKGLLNFSLGDLSRAFDKNINPIHLVAQSNRYSEWWANAKNYKDKGFYVEYNIELFTPADISIQDYARSLEIVAELKDSCMNTISFTKKIPEKRRQQFFNWIKDYFEPFVARMDKFPFNKIIP